MKRILRSLVLLTGEIVVVALLRLASQPSVAATSITQTDARAVLQKICRTCHGVDRVTATLLLVLFFEPSSSPGFSPRTE